MISVWIKKHNFFRLPVLDFKDIK